MIDKKLIQDIKELKANPNLKYSIRDKTINFTHTLFYTLFDHETPIEENLYILEKLFEELVTLVCWEPDKPCNEIWEKYCQNFPNILEDLNKDAEFIFENDPAAGSLEEVYLAYPGFFAIAIYRLSNKLYQFGLPLIPRLMTECAHRYTGVDINPGAVIGVPFFIDHATGVVIGETTEIKNNVKIYQGVTLGALSVDKILQNVKRHPTIEDNVTIYANASILGGNTIIGANSIIGGNVWLTSSVPENSRVSHSPQINIKNNSKQ